MYKLLLILKYLLHRKIAWVALLGVTLCTAMVIVVISIMGGWLRMFETSARGMTGDLVVKGGLSGFPYYDEAIAELQKHPSVEAAVPQINTLGLLLIGGGQDKKDAQPVQVYGMRIAEVGRVNNWTSSLYRQHTAYLDRGEEPPAVKTFDLRKINAVKLPPTVRVPPARAGYRELAGAMSMLSGDLASWGGGRVFDRLSMVPGGPGGDAAADPAVWKNVYFDASEGLLSYVGQMDDQQMIALSRAIDDEDWEEKVKELARLSRQPGLIAGSRLIDVKRDSMGRIRGRDAWKYEYLWAQLTVLGIAPGRQADLSNKAERTYWIVDDSRTGMWQYDQKAVYVPFEVLQTDLGMREHKEKIIATGEERTVPARTTEIEIKLRPGYLPEDVQGDLHKIVSGVMIKHGYAGQSVRVETWRQASQTYLSAIENEKVMMIFLFAMISGVAVLLIFCIFYMLVVEKTRDIGIIRSIGATNGGVAGVFLGYGLTIGLIGASAGVGLAALVVTNINEIHDWLRRGLKLTIWNPEVYAFESIPNRMSPTEVIVIAIVAVVAAVIGAALPALRAARMNPVDALRYE